MILPNDPTFDVLSSTPQNSPPTSQFSILTQNKPICQSQQFPSYRSVPYVYYKGKKVLKLTYHDAWTTKMARCRRKLARQRSLMLKKKSELCSNNNVATTVEIAKQDTKHDSSLFEVDKSLYQFCSPDNKMLRVLLTKELRASDVGSLGRIVLPKKEAEENLPSLHDREGIQLMIADLYTRLEWCMKYKYWINYRSRMYVFENTGHFVKENELEIGDSMTLYEDECKNIYFSIEKGEGSSSLSVANPRIDMDPDPTHEDVASEAMPSEQEAYPYEIMPITVHDQASPLEMLPWTLPSTYEPSTSDFFTPISFEDRDEEDVSLALLIEQLRPKQRHDNNSLFNLGLDNVESPELEFDQVEEGSFDPPAN